MINTLKRLLLLLLSPFLFVSLHLYAVELVFATALLLLIVFPFLLFLLFVHEVVE